MRPWMNIDRGALANIFNQKSKKPVDISIETTSHLLMCSGYVLNNAEDEPEKILVVLKEPKEK